MPILTALGRVGANKPSRRNGRLEGCLVEGRQFVTVVPADRSGDAPAWDPQQVHGLQRSAGLPALDEIAIPLTLPESERGLGDSCVSGLGLTRRRHFGQVRP